MNTPQVHVSGRVYSRVLWLYGLYTLVNNAAFLMGYYWLPEGFVRNSPQTAGGRMVAATQSFWGQLGLTLLLNLGVVTGIIILMNFNQVKGVPLGYVYPFSLGIMTGLIAGTNSFVASDITQFNARDGMALALSIGNLEMLGYIFVCAATVRFGVYQYRSWWRWSGEWRPTKVMNLRDVRLSTSEFLCFILGILLVIFGAYRETLMAFGRLF